MAHDADSDQPGGGADHAEERRHLIKIGPSQAALNPSGKMESVNTELGDAEGLLLVTRHEGVATVTLNRPDKHNAINLAMWQAFSRIMPALDADADIDVVVFRGPAGGPFSAGADISEFTTLRRTPEDAERYGEAVTGGERAIMAFSKPTVAMIEGFAIGGGSQVALACDLRLCEPRSRFGITPAKLGIVYALQSTARLTDVVGPAWASYILMTGDLVDASTALRIGLVHEVTSDLESRTQSLVATLSQRARVSLVGAKALIAKASAGERADDEESRQHYHDSLHSPEYREGVDAFLAKRSPDFKAVRG
ncbi:MAG: Enoyl-CoA hydratase/isomerase [Frankiales bacterium]|nr:Enoyl-CoA hydratase/isomerase [Frankiales bacterium]